MQAIVLAGGRGTRLRSEVPDLPKPMAPIGTRPFLAILLDYLHDRGVRSAVLSVGYLSEAIIRFFGVRYRGLDLVYSVETSPLGTGGAIKLALARTRPGPVLVLNGDTFLRADYSALLRAHERSGLRATVALKNVSERSRYGGVELSNGSVSAFGRRAGPGLINTGLYVLDAQVFDGVELPDAFSFENDFLEPSVEQGRLAINAMIVDSYFIDIGVPEDYRQAVAELAQGRFCSEVAG